MAFGFLLVIVLPLVTSCGADDVDESMLGAWVSRNSLITVRTKPKGMQFEFVHDSASVSLLIHPDKKVSGTIGSAVIENGRIVPNWGLPSSITGVSYNIKCDLRGRIYAGDPLEVKKVEFWIPPKYEIEGWELRYTTAGAQFPMASIRFSRTDGRAVD